MEFEIGLGCGRQFAVAAEYRRNYRSRRSGERLKQLSLRALRHLRKAQECSGVRFDVEIATGITQDVQ